MTPHSKPRHALTDAHRRAFLALNGSICPACGSTNLNFMDAANEIGAFIEWFTCEACERYFQRIFHLADVVEVGDSKYRELPLAPVTPGRAFDIEPDDIEDALALADYDRESGGTVTTLLDGLTRLGVSVADLYPHAAARPLAQDVVDEALARARAEGFHTYDSENRSQVFPPYKEERDE